MDKIEAVLQLLAVIQGILAVLLAGGVVLTYKLAAHLNIEIAKSQSQRSEGKTHLNSIMQEQSDLRTSLRVHTDRLNELEDIVTSPNMEEEPLPEPRYKVLVMDEQGKDYAFSSDSLNFNVSDAMEGIKDARIADPDIQDHHDLEAYAASIGKSPIAAAANALRAS